MSYARYVSFLGAVVSGAISVAVMFAPVAPVDADSTGRSTSKQVIIVTTGDVSPSTPPVTAENDAIASDIAATAEHTVRSVESMAALYRHGQDFDDLVLRIRAQYEDVFAGAWTNPDGPESFVAFKGEIPTDVASLASTYDGIDVTLLSSAAYSFGEMNARAALIHATLTAFGSSEVTIGVDVEGQRILATATPPRGLELLSNAELVSLLPETAQAADVSILFHKGPLVVPAHTYGGAWMRDDGARECTSGFTAKRGSVFGVTTAGHCTGLNEYEQPEDGLVYAAPFVVEHREGPWGDVEFHSTPDHADFARFYADIGDFRSVRAVEPAGAIDKTDAVCGFGRKSLDKHCGSVKFTEFTCGTIGRLVLTDAQGHQKGDSGGPMFFGLTAFGDFYGWCNIGGVVYTAFSVADYFDEAINATVLTE